MNNPNFSKIWDYSNAEHFFEQDNFFIKLFKSKILGTAIFSLLA